ncbi:hypothetical protein H2198_009676 [Neophaeococcomyces mojaviensis]|uniref:Uncharacterized protein n=1 Tax=Neophaeococcomyces mojaviensis TaxID=3383035 RepID=A0ACC2ZU10_9EURO|nr:hypothetical protein H2198_009676 [Knufia sp. JES_112]
MSNYRIIEHKIPCSYIREFPRALANNQEDTLHLAVKQYIPIDNPNPRPGDITIIAAHANGFPKELYEPLWEDLLTTSKKKHSFRIRSIWIADVAHQGASSVLNENLLGNDPGWFDHPRDLTHFINLKRDEMPRPIFGIGHSMGGNNLVNVALFNPRLFTSLILIDPVIQARSAEIQTESKTPNIAQLSTFRRDIWPSRSEATKLFLKSPFYKAWDTRVFDRWVQHGLRELPTSLYPDEQAPKVTLTTTVANEVHTFLRPNYEGYGLSNPTKKINRDTHPDIDPTLPNLAPFYRSEAPRTFARLPELRPSVLYIFGELSDVSGPSNNEAKVAATGIGVGGSGGKAEGRVKGVTIEGVGHLIAMEACERTAEETATWIDSEMVRWKKQEEVWEKEWKSKSLREKQALDEQWKAAMGGDPRAKKRAQGNNGSKL